LNPRMGVTPSTP